MQYMIQSVRVKNFKCFDNSKFFEFKLNEDKSPIILTGPNGFGKTTFFDALELLFSNKITRFDTKIENKSTNLQKNILLNKAEADGYIVVTLINSKKDYMTIFAKIDHNMCKVSYNESVKFGACNKYILTAELLGYLTQYTSWQQSLADFNILKYSAENFNVYYYVSQAESVHFLKKTIVERKDAMNALLDLGRASDWQTHIKSKLIGNRSNTTGVLINDEINKITNEIEKDIEKLKRYVVNDELRIKVEYAPLLLVKSNNDIPYWDSSCLDNYSVDQLNNGIWEVECLSSYVKDLDDYNKYLWNNKIDSLLHCAIKDVVLLYPYINGNKVDIDAISRFINQENQLIEIYNNSKFFRTVTLSAELFKSSNIERIKSINPQLITFDIQEVSLLCNQIIKLNKKLTDKQNILNNLENARSILKKMKTDYYSESSQCPYCGYQYVTIEELNKAFYSTKEIIEKDKGDELISLNILKEKLLHLVEDSKKAINQLTSGITDEIAQDTLLTLSFLREIVTSPNKIKNVEFIYSLIPNKEQLNELGYEEKALEIRRVCFSNKKKYTNELFVENMKKYAYSSIQAKYPQIIFEEQKLLLNDVAVKNKILFIKSVINKAQNEEAQLLREQIKNNLKKRYMIVELRNNFDKLEKKYLNATNLYKNQILKKLRVPLLIYTGKILQDYQNGLGVFISKDEMRFVTNGDVKNDILNTFSSGQLSGFVLAFLFSMNKQYIKESEDDLGFLLIDDPVQTMDDINISSMIEVLRNDFSDKQIIISTHEADKENYILYKFFKYNQIGQSFNVKDKLYGV